MGARFGLSAALAGCAILGTAAALTVGGIDVNDIISGGGSELVLDFASNDAAEAGADGAPAAREVADVETISRGAAVSLARYGNDADLVVFEFTADW